MFHDQVVNFLQAAVVFLLATNAASILVALYAMRLANQERGRQVIPAVGRRIETLMGRGS